MKIVPHQPQGGSQQNGWRWSRDHLQIRLRTGLVEVILRWIPNDKSLRHFIVRIMCLVHCLAFWQFLNLVRKRWLFAFKLMEFLHGKMCVMEDKKKYVFIFSNTWWEKAEATLLCLKSSFPVQRNICGSRYNSSFIDFPKVMIDSKKEALSEVQLYGGIQGHR